MILNKNTCEVQSRTVGQTVAGTVNPTYSTRIATLKCSIQGKTLTTANTFGKPTQVNVYNLYTLIDSTSSTIAETDRVIWRGKKFEITGIEDAAGRGHHFQIDMLEVK